MPEFTYYAPVATANIGSIIIQEELKHHYFAQLSPDDEHLVQGMLQQGKQPAIGKWIDVGNVDREFSRRYFVQYTNFNTLVPGSLIESCRLPKGKWKEIKKSVSLLPFHRVSFAEPYFVIDDLGGTTTINNSLFVTEVMRPVIHIVHPDIDFVFGPAVSATFFYFKGDYAEFNKDLDKLTIFGGEESLIYIEYIFGGQPINGFRTVDLGNYNFQFSTGLPKGLYSFILGIISEEGFSEYFVLENILSIN